jgi:hypothetical protein
MLTMSHTGCGTQRLFIMLLTDTLVQYPQPQQASNSSQPPRQLQPQQRPSSTSKTSTRPGSLTQRQRLVCNVETRGGQPVPTV